MRGAKGRLIAALIAAAVCIGCGGGSTSAFHDGQKAEQRKDWDTALIDYQKALQAQPENAHFIIHEKVARQQAALFHLKKGRTLLADGRPDEASGEFQRAVSIDPTNQAAAQELEKLMAQQAAAKQAREKALQEALKGREESTYSGAVQLKALPQDLHLFKFSTDSRKAYEALAKLAGLNVAFTSDFQPRQVALDLNDVKIEDALRILALQTKSFWKAVTPNTILVIQDTPGNRRDYEDEVVKTVYLSNNLAQADRTAISTALQKLLGMQKIADNQDSNAIIIRDTPEKVAAAEKLIRDLDQGKAEIQIEVQVVEADRDRVRDLGISPATVSSSGTITNGIQTGIGFSPGLIAGTTTAATGISASHPGHVLNDYAAVLPSAVASAVLNDTRTHILQNPQVRVTDGQTAKVKIGSRIPYATGSFGFPGAVASTSTSASQQYNPSLLSSTQFQFEDVGVNLELTPHLLNDGEVSLKASIEISSEGAPSNLGGLNEPTFNQRKIDHIIQLKEGEVSVLGGLIESTLTIGNSGVPGLGELPLIGYLFSSKHYERLETEVLVMLTPRVVRLPVRSSEAAKGVAVSGQSGPPLPGAALPIEQQ